MLLRLHHQAATRSLAAGEVSCSCVCAQSSRAQDAAAVGPSAARLQLHVGTRDMGHSRLLHVDVLLRAAAAAAAAGVVYICGLQWPAADCGTALLH